MTKFIDFNDLAAGTVVDNAFSTEGVTISAIGGSNKAMIFDTANPTGGDHDLETTNLNKALIISEDGDRRDPDDEAGGGTLRFVFDEPSTINRLTFLDTEESAWVRFYDANGQLITTVDVHGVGDNGQKIVDFDVEGVVQMDVILGGSGAIDNLVFDTTGDGVVEDGNDSTVIDADYEGDPDGDRIDADDAVLPGEGPNDDIVDALGGDDTIRSGDADDDVYAGSGNDSVLGGDGNDIIYGDSNYAGPGAGVFEREVFEWEKSPFGDGNALGNFTQDTGKTEVTFTILNQSGPSRTIQSNDIQNVQNIDGDGSRIDNNSSLDNILNGHGNSADYQLEFSAAVEDVSFRINDIDGDGVVRVKAYNAAGQQIIVNLEGGRNLTLLDTDGVAGNDTADSNGGYLSDTSEEYSLLVSIPGPVARIVIEHDQDGGDNSGINITDVYFDTPIIDDGADGNDTLQGGIGDDTIFGEGGNDTLKGEDGNDSLVGGEGGDRLEGGKGDDLLDGGAGRDVLLGAAGDDTALGGDGDDEIWAGSGNDSVDGGNDNDWIHGQAGDDTLNGEDGDDMVFGESGDDFISGGAGADTLRGGDDADTIFAGAGDDVDGGAGGFSADPTMNTDLDVLDLTGQGPFYLENVTPDSNGNGINGTVVFVDGAGNPNGLTLTFTEIEEVIGDEVNRGPDALDDVATVDEDGSVDIAILANDSDPDGDPLRVTEATSPDGVVTINPDGTITFEPDENFNGATTITYTVTDDNGGEDTAVVNVTVTPVNDAPEAADDAETTPFNTAVTLPVLDNDTDVDGDALRVTEATSPDGDVVINGDGTLTFTPNDGFEGDAVIDYTITDDNGGFDSAQVTVTVEPNPLDGIVEGSDDGELIDEDYMGDPEGDMVDNGDNIFSDDPDDADDDIIEAGGCNDTVISGQGDDVVDGGDGDDLIETGNGDIAPDLGFPTDSGTPVPGFPFGFPADDDPNNDLDFVDGGAGDDTISTGDDADTIVGGTGNDVIDGGIDDDEISGDEGTDRIVGGEGNDLIEGGVGDDTIFAGNDPDLGLDQLNIEDDGSNPVFPADPRPDNGRDTVFGGEGNDLIFGADDDDALFGEEGNDTIDGEIDDDLIDGGIGDDSLLGGQGNDTILGGAGNDFIDAGRQADTVDGGAGNDTILGDNGADVLSGGAGDDFIDGGTGDDTLNGDAGNDVILGSTGDDVIDGGTGNDTIDGGNGGADIMRGGDDRDLFINVDAGEVVDGGGGGDDFDTLDLRGSAPNNGSLQVVFTNPDDNGNGFDGVVNYFDENGDPAGTLTFTDIEDVIPCFTPGTMIATPTGERRIEELQVGDRVITRDNGIQEIRWVGSRAMSGEELARARHLRPVLIQKGALGKGLPERDMLVSPQHRVLMASDKTALYFDESEVLVAAKHLTFMDGIDVVEVSGTTYIHVMFDQHEVILSDGAWTESFQPGDMTLNAMTDAQRAEILELFPELDTADGTAAYAAARRSLKKHEAHLLTH